MTGNKNLKSPCVKRKPSSLHFFKCWDNYVYVSTFLNRAVNPKRPTLSIFHPENRSNLENAHGELHAFRAFEGDLGVEILQGVHSTIDPSQFDQVWFESMDQAHYNLIQVSDTALRSQPPIHPVERNPTKPI